MCPYTWKIFPFNLMLAEFYFLRVRRKILVEVLKFCLQSPVSSPNLSGGGSMSSLATHTNRAVRREKTRTLPNSSRSSTGAGGGGDSSPDSRRLSDSALQVRHSLPPSPCFLFACQTHFTIPSPHFLLTCQTHFTITAFLSLIVSLLRLAD